MRKIEIKLNNLTYEIYIGSCLLYKLGNYLKQLDYTGKVVIITNPIVEKLYGNNLKKRLLEDGFEVSLLKIPDGEKQKSLNNAMKLYRGLSDFKAERNTPIIALGGGVIGDLAGFVAATYLRGLPLIQVPTTLLAQVDSSIGGKVAVDFNNYKNQIGSFYQPRLVLADISTLNTLPVNEIKNGLAEVIKSAVIKDTEFFEFIERNMEHIKSLDEKILEEIVYRSAKIKAEIVIMDERDYGLRHILNYGHTLGHAIETASNYKIKHGMAVAIGMATASKISNQINLLPSAQMERLIKTIKNAGLPTKISELKIKLNEQKIIKAMSYDKKIINSKIRFILLHDLGNAFIFDNLSTDLITKALENE